MSETHTSVLKLKSGENRPCAANFQSGGKEKKTFPEQKKVKAFLEFELVIENFRMFWRVAVGAPRNLRGDATPDSDKAKFAKRQKSRLEFTEF